jgi:hypothetical protein
MNRNDARKIAQMITNEQLQQMFDNAQKGIKDWTKVSSCNKGFTKGVAWNILVKSFDLNYDYHILAKTNMIREFGEFLPDVSKPEKKKKQIKSPVHQDPIFKVSK